MNQQQTLERLVNQVERMEKTLEHLHFDIEEIMYPPENLIKSSYVEKVERVAKKGKYTRYKSVDALRKEIESA